MLAPGRMHEIGGSIILLGNKIHYYTAQFYHRIYVDIQYTALHNVRCVNVCWVYLINLYSLFTANNKTKVKFHSPESKWKSRLAHTDTTNTHTHTHPPATHTTLS